MESTCRTLLIVGNFNDVVTHYWAEVKPAQATENNVASEEEEDEDGENGEPTSAYTTLLQTLQATNESFAKAYAPRYTNFSFE